jgi:modulator of FtsH protease HflC
LGVDRGPGRVVVAVAGRGGRVSMFTVDESEQAIVVQFGAPVGDPITDPGLHFRIPLVQEVRRFDKRLLSWDGDPNQIPTVEEQFISVDTTARWRIVDPLKFLQSVQNEMGAQSRLNDILDSVVRDKIASSSLVDIVRSKDWKVSEEDLRRAMAAEGDEEILLQEVVSGREELVRSILETAQLQMPQYGIELVDIRIKRIDYVESVQKQVFERMIAERQRIAEQFRSEGEGRAAEIGGETDRLIAEIKSEAERDADIIRGQADAEATQIYNEAYGRRPEFYAFFRTLESYTESLSQGVTLVISSDSDYFHYLSHGVFCEGVAVKYAWIREHRDSFPVAVLCRVLEVSTSGYYAALDREPSPGRCGERIQAAVQEVHAASHGIYGSHKVARELAQRPDLESACRNTVAKAMRELGLKSRAFADLQADDHAGRSDQTAGSQPSGPRLRGRGSQPQVGGRHHLPVDGRWLGLSGRRARLVHLQSQQSRVDGHNHRARGHQHRAQAGVSSTPHA